jgi:flagellar basal-body rod modification protein FlgD
MDLPAAISAEASPPISELRRENQNSNAESASTSLNQDFDSFMLLLTTQLQNQDPTDPLDTNEMTSQLVQFTGVEQAIQTNRNLESLISLTGNQQVNAAVGFIGKTVEASGAVGFLENGTAEFAYEVPLGASSVALALLDENDRVVYTTEGETGSGRHQLQWDGINSFNSSQMPDGAYTLGIQVRDAKGEVLDGGKARALGTVTSVDIDGDVMKLTLNGSRQVDLADVITVREPTANNDNG